MTKHSPAPRCTGDRSAYGMAVDGVVANAQRSAHDEHPPDTPTAVYRVVSITQTPRAAGTVVQGTQTLTAWVTAALTPDGWRIDTLRF